MSAAAGRTVFPWQRDSLIDIQAVREDGNWAAFEAAILASRQNGKTGIIESLEFDWMMAEPGVRIMHTAHELRTAGKSLKKLVALIKGIPGCEGKPGPSNALLSAVRTAHGEAAVEFHNGSFVDFSTRTGAGGRGTSYDRLIVDEAMIYTPESQSALQPLLNTGHRPQIVYAGSAPDEDSMDYCHIWADLYWRALEGGDPSLCYLGWLCEPGADDNDPREWAKSNPSMGYLFPVETIANHRRAMRANLHKFQIEYMSIGKWPKPHEAKTVIDMTLWSDMAQAEPKLMARGPIAVAVDMTPDRRWVTIAAAQRTEDERIRVEIGFHEAPSKRVIDRIGELIAKWDPCCVVLNQSSPAKSLLADLQAIGIAPEVTTASQMAEACGGFYDDALNGLLSHADDPRLTEALRGVEKKKMSDGRFGWDYLSDVIISPLQAATLARWGLVTFGVFVPPAQSPTTTDDSAGSVAEYDELMTAGF